MIDLNCSFITLGAQVGGKYAFDATNSHILAFRRLLADVCRGPYGDTTIKEIALVLRVDGSIQYRGKSGVEGVAIRQKRGYATADIYVPRDAWASGDLTAFRSFLTSGVKVAIAEIAESSRRKGVDLLRDVLLAAAKFTAT